jgi:hypothetical protein
MDSRDVAICDSSFQPVLVQTALMRADAAADAAYRRVPFESPERALWFEQSERLLQALHRTLRGADPSVRAAITQQLDDIVTTSLGDVELLRRLIILAKHVHDYAHLCADPRVPAEVRDRALALRFELFDQVARVRRDPEIEGLL